MHKSFLPLWRTIGLCLLVLSFAVLTSRAQEFRGTLVGHVTDSSGAAVTGATITVVGPQAKFNVTSNQTGDFIVPFVPPATYTLTAEQTGFKKAVRADIPVDISSRVKVDFVLQVGAQTESVTVDAGGAAQLDTESASGGTVMDPEKTQDLPNSGRMIYNLIGLTAGAQFTQTQFGANGFSGTRAWDENNAYSLNGVNGNMNNFSLNGAPISTPNGGGNGTWNISPAIDSIQEFKVMMNNYDSQYGRYAGGTVNTVLKSGSRIYHGSASDNWRNSIFDANTFDRNQVNEPRLFHNEHQFDITFGGPVIPHHDKMYFFFSFEGYRQVQPAGIITSVPTADTLPGSGPNGGVDLTGILTYRNEIGPTAQDPTRTIGIYSPNQPLTCINGTAAACNEWERQPYAGNVIPASEITPIASKIMALFPKPNLPGYANNYAYSGDSTHKYNQPIASVDYNFTQDTKVKFTFAWWSGLEYRNGSGFPGAAANGNINNYRSDVAPVVDFTHNFSPMLFGDLRLAFNRTWDLGPSGAVSAGLATLTPGDVGLTMPATGTTKRNFAPTFKLDNYNQLVGNTGDPSMFETYDLAPSLTHVIGRHNLHYGLEYMLFHVANSGVGNANGNFNFGTGYTWENPAHGNNTGNDIADTLLGYPDGGSVETKYNTYKSYDYYAGFFQDDWKVTSRLAFNLGLRWDTETSPTDRNNYLMAGLCLTCTNSLSSKITYPAGLPNGASMVSSILGVAQFSSSKLTPYADTWGALQPKFGFTYALTPKIVVRGGYGLQSGEGIELGGASAWDQGTNYNAQINSAIWQPSQAFKTGSPYPNGLTPVLGTSQGDQTLVGEGIGIDQRDRKLLHTHQYSLGVQAQLPFGIIGELGYAGVITTNMRTSRQYNGLSDADVAKTLQIGPNYLDQQVNNPFYGVLPNTVSMGANPTIAAKLLMVPYPEFNGNVYIYTHANGWNDYDSMIAKAEKRMSNGGSLSRGLSFMSSFTWAKQFNAQGYLNNSGAWKVDADTPYRQEDGGGNAPTWQLSFSGLYGLPVGRGGTVLSDAHGLLGEVVNDWQLGWVFQNRAGTSTGYPNGQPFNCGTYDPKPAHKSWSTYMNNSQTSCWANSPEYWVNTFGTTNTKVRNPWAQQSALSMNKKFALKDQLNLLFKAEAFNATNAVIFGGPDGGSPQNALSRVQSVANPNQPGAWSGYGTVGSSQQNFPRMMQFTLKLEF